jgi:peptidyl-prolyl cis-trans isomerase C
VQSRHVRRWWASPILQFALGGALLFALDFRAREADDKSASRPRIVIGAERVAQAREEHRERYGALPEPAELTALLDAEIADELLYQEALRLGLDRDDQSIRWRVLQKMRFVSEAPDRSDDELVREGLALGLDRDDLVIRRILAQKMRLLAQLPARSEALEEDALAEYLEAHREIYRQAPRISLTHVFLSRQQRPATLEADANALLERLRSEDVPADRAETLGDPFPLGRRLRAQTQRQLEKQLGPQFAERAMSLDPGVWSGPVRSAYGLHLVFVEEKIPGRDPPLAEIRTQVEQRLRAERGERRVTDLVRQLRDRYEVQIAPQGEASPAGAG